LIWKVIIVSLYIGKRNVIVIFVYKNYCNQNNIVGVLIMSLWFINYIIHQSIDCVLQKLHIISNPFISKKLIIQAILQYVKSSSWVSKITTMKNTEMKKKKENRIKHCRKTISVDTVETLLKKKNHFL